MMKAIDRVDPIRWFQWEYWNFAGGLDGDLVVEYGDDGGTGFIGRLADATIEEKPAAAAVVKSS
jgi:hypothetical protein